MSTRKISLLQHQLKLLWFTITQLKKNSQKAQVSYASPTTEQWSMMPSGQEWTVRSFTMKPLSQLNQAPPK